MTKEVISIPFCYNCGTQVKEKYLFCVKCGEPNINSPPAKKIHTENCMKCGKLIDETLRFCSDCGTPTSFNLRSGIQMEEEIILKPPLNNNYDHLSSWAKEDIERKLISQEEVEYSAILSHFPFGMKKTYGAVTKYRVIGKTKYWFFSFNSIDIPLRDVSRVEYARINFDSIIFFLLSLLLSYYIIGIPFLIFYFFRLRERKLYIVSRLGTRFIEGLKKENLETFQKKIREFQFQNDIKN